MRNCYIVCYDICDPRRLRRVHDKMLGFGDPLQYSVFECNLSRRQKVLMIAALTELINHREDRVMIVDIGPTEGRSQHTVEFLGRVPADDRGEEAVIV